jgi:class 3 adenylate cyclase
MNIMPLRIVNELKETGRTQPESFENVAVLFSDIVGFTNISSGLEPEVLINELNDIFTAFDNVIEANECERIKTIGDAYMAVCGLPVPNERYADNIVRSTVLISQYLRQKNKNSSFQWKVKIGVHAGRVVGGVVGVKKYIYDVFGSTVNLASRLQSATKLYEADVLISDSVYNKLNYPEDFHIREIDTVRVKGEFMPIRLYEVFDNDEEYLREQKIQSLSVLKEGLELYKEGVFQEARQRFVQCQEICPPDFLPPLYIKRCNILIRIPPGPDWSGVNGI